MRQQIQQLAHILSCWPAWLAVVFSITGVAHAATPWDQPAAQLADRISSILGSGQAQLVVNNRSSIAAAEMSVIRRILEDSLRTHSVVASGSESANLIRITLSENARERLWIAEVFEGSQSQIAMVHFGREQASTDSSDIAMILQKKPIWSSTQMSAQSGSSTNEIHPPVIAALTVQNNLILLTPAEILVVAQGNGSWREQQWAAVGKKRSVSRDPRGLLLPAPDGGGFSAHLPGAECQAEHAELVPGADPGHPWSIRCHESDDPWPISSEAKAFYNAARDFFTGVLNPNRGIDFGPFYSIAPIARPGIGTPAWLVGGIDGKVQVEEAGSLQPVSGTRDWGSDFAVLHSACGLGTEIVASSSGEAQSDSLRGYELPAHEAIPASAPIDMGGSVTALWTAPDGASVWAVVLKNGNAYEVDRVTALCP